MSGKIDASVKKMIIKQDNLLDINEVLLSNEIAQHDEYILESLSTEEEQEDLWRINKRRNDFERKVRTFSLYMHCILLCSLLVLAIVTIRILLSL